jgi:hypothetical protein
MDVRMPDGTLVRNVPDNITQTDLLARYNKFQPSESEEKPSKPTVEIGPAIPNLYQQAKNAPEISTEMPEFAQAIPESLRTPFTGSLVKGVTGVKSSLAENQLAGLMELHEADVKKYGANFEKAPEKERVRILEREQAIQEKFKDLAGYSMQNKAVEEVYGKSELAKKLDVLTAKPEYKDATGLQKTGMYLSTLGKNLDELPGYIVNIGAESLPQSVSVIAAALAGRVGFGRSGAMTAGGSMSAFNEFGGNYADLRSQGMPHEEAWQKAAVKSGVIGYFDAASFGSAGIAAEKILGQIAKKEAIKSTIKEVGKETGKQALYGAAGEGLGSYVIGQPFDPRAVGEEAFGEVVGAPLEAATTYRQKRAEANAPITSTTEEPQFVRDEQGNLVPAPKTTVEPKGTVTLGPIENIQQQDLFGAGELPNQVDQSPFTENERKASEIERNIFALQQQEQTPEVKQQIADLQAQLPKGPGQTLDVLQQEHGALGRAYTALEQQKAALIQQRDATPKLDDKLVVTEQIKNIEVQQAQITARSAEIGVEGDKLAKQIEPEGTAQRKLKEVSPIVGNVMSKFGLAPKAPIRNAIKNLDMTVPEDRATFIDEINKHAIKKAKINMDEVEKYLSYFEEKPSEELNRANAGAIEPSLPVPREGSIPAEGTTAPISTGVESNIGTAVGPRTGTETLQNVQSDSLEEPTEPSATPYPENKKTEPAKSLTRQEMLNTKHEGTNLPLAMYGAGPAGIFKTTPINKPSLFHETSPTNANELIKEDLLETRITGQLFLTDNRDIAIGQKGKNGVLIEYDGNSVSGREHKKPGTGDIAGREYVANAIGKNAIKSITIQKGSNIQLIPSVLRKLKENFDVVKNDDGSVTYTKKEIPQPIVPSVTPQAAPQTPDYGREINPNTAAVLQQPNVTMGAIPTSNVVEGQASVSPKQVELQNDVIHDELTSKEQAQLAVLYGQDEYNDVAKARFIDDFIKAINEGLDKVHKVVANIVRRLQATVLATAIIMNPNYMSPASIVLMPVQQQVTTTEQVRAEVPKEVKGMSDGAKKAYSVLMPALQDQGKYFTIVDKPSATVYVFNSDGSLVKQSKVLLGKAFGDFYKGGTDFVQNRITPAGNFVVNAEKGGATYDGKTIYTVGNVDEGWSAAIFHTVYTKESDAKARLAALDKEGPEDSRYSHGCINGSPNLMEAINNEKMDKSHMFVVPDNPELLDSFISNTVPNTDLTRATVEPKTVTKTTTERGQGVSTTGGEDQFAIRREDSKTAALEELRKQKRKPRNVTPSELAQAKELFGEYANDSIALLRSGFTLDDIAKALGIKQKPTSGPTSEGKQILSNLQAAGAVAPKAKTGWFTKEVDDVDNALNKSMLDKVKDFVGFGNFFSFDQEYMNVMRSEFLKLGNEGKIAMKDAIDGFRRVEITQVLYRGQLAPEAINIGKLVYNAITNRQKVVPEKDNMGDIRTQLKVLANRVGISVDDALAAASKGFEANRIQSVYDKMDKAKAEITRIEKKIQAKVDTEQNKKMLKKLKADVETYESQVQHMTRQQAMEGMKIYNNVPEVQEIARVWTVMRKRTVDKLVESGVTSEEKAEKWLDEMAYVPFFRTIKEQKAAGALIYKKGLGESMKEYAFEGSMLPVENTIGNMYQWMQWSYSRAISNQHQQVALDQMRALFPDMVKDGKDPRGYTFSIYRDGVKRDYTVANPLVAQYFMGVGNVVFGNKNAITQGINLFTKGITLVPGFSATQLILKDTYEAMHTSGVQNPYGIITNIFQEMYKTATNTSEARKELISRGQLSTREHAMAASHDADIATKLEVKEAAIHSKLISMLGKFSALSDNLLRQAVYQQLRNENVSEDEAASRATEIFNYRRTSGSTAMQFLNNYVPFMNAFTVSTKVAMNTISGKGITAQTRTKGITTLAQATALIGMGNLIYMMMVGDSEEYKRMNRYRRDKSYIIPGTGASIPLREGWFILDKLAAEYAYNLAMNSDVTDAQMFKDAAARAIVKQVIPPVSPLVTAPLGTALNKDLTNLPDVRDIVNVSQSKELPQYQMNKNTSELAKVIGKEGNMSPLKVDYFLKTATGGFMSVMTGISNEYIAEKRGKPLPAKENANIPLEVLGFGSYLSKPGTPNVVPDLYTAAHEVDKIKPTVLKLAQTDKEAARELRDKNREGMGLGEMAAGIGKTFSALNRAEAMIREKKSTDIVEDNESPFYGKPYTPEVKKAMIDGLDKKRNALTPKVMELRKKIYEK